MVEIRRPTRARSSASFWSCRNIILLAVLCQLLSMIVSLLRTSPKPTIDRKLQEPKGVQDVLEAWRGGGERIGTSKTATKIRRHKPHHSSQNEEVKVEANHEQANGDPEPNTAGENANPEDANPDDANPEDANPEEEPPNVVEENNKDIDNEEKSPGDGGMEIQEGGEDGKEGADVADGASNAAKAGEDIGEPEARLAIESNGEVSEKRGSGPTSLGYLADYQYERENPPFRNSTFPEEFSATEEKVAFQFRKKEGVNSCRYVENRKLLTRSQCRDPDATLIAYNSAPFLRTWCQLELEPNSIKRVEEPCSEPVRVLPVDSVPVNGEDMPPIIIASVRMIGEDYVDFVPCDIPCQAETNLRASQLYVAGTDWRIYQTWDDPFSNPDARVERTAYRKEVYYSTTSFKSSVPLSFYSFDKFDLRNTKAVDYDTAESKASYLIDKDCITAGSRRHKWFSSMKAHYPVAALGACHHNTQLQSGESLSTLEGRLSVLKKYKFNMAFDLMTEKDHIPAFVWESLVSGSLPIILGAQNLKDHLPAKSFISASDFSLWDLMSKHVVNVAANKTLWESYHAWRNDKDLLDAFELKYNFTRTSPICRMCRWAYARKYGLGWDHSQQVVKENRLTRKLCADSHSGLAFSPFQEAWFTGTDRSKALRPAALSTCPELTNLEGTIEVSDNVKVHRSVVPHDGVTDISIHNIEVDHGDVVLQLEFDVRNSEGAYFPNTHRLVDTQNGALVSSISIQDQFSKVTVLANWEIAISSPVEGVIEIIVQEDGEMVHQDQEKRIRVITEDMNVLHDKMTEFFPSPFCKLMTKDFVDPVETFYIES